MVRGEGPIPCSLAIVGEGPGWQEDKAGRPFVGRTGAELERYLEGLGLARRDIYLTNLYRYYGGKDYEYTAEDYARDEPLLREELDRVQPTTIVPLGRHATRYFLGDVDLESTWGLPWRTDRAVICPIHHPAAGMHNPEMSPYVVAGFTALGQYLSGNLTPRTLYDDPYPETHYEAITDEARLVDVFETVLSASAGLLSIDTEGWPRAPWSLQFTTQPGTGFLLRADSPLIAAFGRLLTRHRPTLLFHSALHDLQMMRVLGLPMDLPFEDTMVAAYLLQLEPQGLKQGALRHCNMKMDAFADLMGDTENELARDYLLWLWQMLDFEHNAKREEEYAARLGAGRRIRTVPKLPKRDIHKAVERCLRSKRPRSLWLDQDEAYIAEGITRLGFVPEASLSDVEPEKAIHYGCRDADATIRYHAELMPRIKALGLEDIYKLELATYPFIERMAHVGVKPDLQQFAALGVALGYEIETLTTDLRAATGDPAFNANSGDHVAEYLFNRLGLAPLKMTKSGSRGSTNDKILEALERANPRLPVISKIRHFRELYKLKYTFVDPMPAYVNRWPFDGRVHCTFRATRVITGRLASSDPNMLAQPERGGFEDGWLVKEFKRGWIAEPGHVVCAWDESQVELRQLAHLSQDPVLLAAFRNGDDLHDALAVRIFGGKKGDYTGKCHERFAVKEINFGLPNGMGPVGLMVALRSKGVEADEDTAARWIAETDALYAGVPVYKQRQIDQVKRQGYIQCESGRMRYIGGIDSRDERVRAEAERLAFSTPIQEGAAWIMKQVEVRVWAMLQDRWKRGQWVEPLLQTHDCLKMECQEGLEYELHRDMDAMMTIAPPGFSVPLAVEGEHGYNFADMEVFQ